MGNDFWAKHDPEMMFWSLVPWLVAGVIGLVWMGIEKLAGTG